MLAGVSSDRVEMGGLNARKAAISARGEEQSRGRFSPERISAKRGCYGGRTRERAREPGVRSLHLPRRLARSLAPSHCSRPCLSWGPREGQTPGGCGGPAALGGGGSEVEGWDAEDVAGGRPAPEPAGGKAATSTEPHSRGGAGAAVEQRLVHLSALLGASLATRGLSLCRLRTPRGYGAGLRSVLGRKQPLVICLPRVRRCCPRASNLQDSSLPGFKCTFVPSQSRKERRCCAFSGLGNGLEYPGGLQFLAPCQELEIARGRHFL